MEDAGLHTEGKHTAVTGTILASSPDSPSMRAREGSLGTRLVRYLEIKNYYLQNVVSVKR